MSLVIEEKYDQVRQLINIGKERGYLLYDEVNDLLPAEVHSSEEIDDLLSTFEPYGIDVYEDVSIGKPAPAAAEAAETESKEELLSMARTCSLSMCDRGRNGPKPTSQGLSFSPWN